MKKKWLGGASEWIVGRTSRREREICLFSALGAFIVLFVAFLLLELYPNIINIFTKIIYPSGSG
jgi:hypothetical protein